MFKMRLSEVKKVKEVKKNNINENIIMNIDLEREKIEKSLNSINNLQEFINSRSECMNNVIYETLLNKDEYDQYMLILYQDGLLTLHGIHYIILIDSIKCLRQDILDMMHINARFSYPQIKQQISNKFKGDESNE